MNEIEIIKNQSDINVKLDKLEQETKTRINNKTFLENALNIVRKASEQIE
jgi:hypothetical protein